VSASRRTTGLVPLVSAARREEGAAALAARHGAAGDRPGLRKDLVIRRLVQIGEVKWVVKDAQANAYYNFDDGQWGLIQLFDGTRTVEEIHRTYQAQFPKDTIEKSLILEYLEILRGLDFIEKSVAEKNLTLLARSKTARQRAAEEKAEGFNPFFLLFHVVDPDEFLGKTLKYVRWLWTPPVVAVACAFFAWTLGVIVVHWDTIWIGTKELYALGSKPFLDLLQFILIITFIGGIHESAHGYVTKKYGGEVHDMGIALVYATPAFYCNTTDALLFENKWHEFWVTTAGIYIEAWICSLATVFWVVSYPDTFVNEFAFKAMLYTGVSTIFLNINPLIKIDGYYALSSVLEIPELREESIRYIGASFQRHVLRLHVDMPQASQRKRRIYWIYGTLALAWVAVIMRFVGGLFYNLYNRYFPNWAVVLLIVTMYRLFRKRVRLVMRTTRLVYLDKKEFVMSARTRRPLLAASIILALILVVPWSRRTLQASAVLNPLQTVRLEAPEDAVVVRALVHEGDRVIKGQPVFQLVSPAAMEEVARLSSEGERLRSEASRGRQSAEPGKVFRSEQRGTSLQAALRSGQAREERLIVRSTVAGRILTAYPTNLEGRSVPAGTLLAEVGDDRRMTAELAVSERLLDDLERGTPVSALFRGRFAAVRGSIASISPAASAAPPTATTGSDPAAPTIHPEQFVAVAVFENPDGRLLAGAKGSAKMYGRRASFASRAWRVVKRWFQSVAW
jgi:putative peptide zinc metalloprotease protein